MRTKVAKTTQQKPLAPQIVDYGTLSELTWPGGVSAQSLIQSGVTSRKIIADAIQRLNEFYVSVEDVAKTRCIDGRRDPELDEKCLGAQVPGGTPGAALAYRLGVMEDDLSHGTFLADGEAMIDTYLRLGFAPGGHRDEHSVGKASVGCGAIDAMDRAVVMMLRPDLVKDHERLTKLLLGQQFDEDYYRQIMGASTLLSERSEEYFHNREAIMDYLEKRVPNSTATLQGDHQECLVVINMVPGTTLSSNRFAKTFDGMQAFGYDAWRTIEMADKLFPETNATEYKQRFITARVMTAIATLMALTDGSQNLVVRTAS